MNATKKIKNLRLFALFVVPSVFIWMTVVIIPLLYGCLLYTSFGLIESSIYALLSHNLLF